MGHRIPLPDELRDLGLYEPGAPDADDRLELLQYLFERGASVDDVRASTNLGELALDLHLRPRTDLTLRDVLESAAIEPERARRLLNATGVAFEPEDHVTADEAATLRLFIAASDELLGDDATVQLARVAGNAMARMAESIVTAFRLQFELPQRARGGRYVDVVKQYAAIAEAMLPEFVRSLDVMLRREIIAVSERVWTTDAEQSAVTLPRAVGFADLVGFTAAASTMSARELASVLVTFEERASEIILGHRGQVVKTIGDEVLFTAERAESACGIALELREAFGRGALPELRVGVAAGDVVSINGDVFGPDVNLASRLVGLADPSTVLVSESVRRASDQSFQFASRGDVAVKGFPGTVPVFELVGAV